MQHSIKRIPKPHYPNRSTEKTFGFRGAQKPLVSDELQGITLGFKKEFSLSVLKLFNQ